MRRSQNVNSILADTDIVNITYVHLPSMTKGFQNFSINKLSLQLSIPFIAGIANVLCLKH